MSNHPRAIRVWTPTGHSRDFQAEHTDPKLADAGWRCVHCGGTPLADSPCFVHASPKCTGAAIDALLYGEMFVRVTEPNACVTVQ